MPPRGRGYEPRIYQLGRVSRTNSRNTGGAVQLLHLRRTGRFPLRRLPKGRGNQCLTFISVNCATSGRSQSIAKRAKNLSVRIVGIVPRTAKTRGKKMIKECNCEGDCLATRECVFCEGVADLLWFDDNGQKYVCVGCVKDGEIDSKGETNE